MNVYSVCNKDTKTLLVGFYSAVSVPEAETVKHSASNTRVMGLIPIGKCMN